MGDLSIERHLALFEQMQRIRTFEEKVVELRTSGDIVGSVHLENGQEAVSVGAVSALDLERDAVFPTYRGHGYTLACGVPESALFGELLGRQTGINGGRGGSAYHFAPAYGMYGENSIVGAGTVIAAGAALAAQFDGSNRVSLAAFGDGALNQGAVHEAFNFAASRKLPVVFLVENNGYSELTPTRDMVGSDRFFARAWAYGFEGVRVDGNDVLAVQAAVKSAVDAARAGDGPTLIEAMTARIVGHYIGDAQHYRPEGEVSAALASEPLVVARTRLIDRGVEESRLDEIISRVRAEIENAAAEALQAPLADPATIGEHLYA